jgi:outer membrane protein assembly factor BamB
VTDFETSSNLKAIDLATQAWKWSVSGLFTSPPALSAGVLYVVNGGQFQARSPDTGALLWAWACPDACSGDSVDLVDRNRVVVAGNLAFFSALTHTYALDLATHQSVWSDPAVGALALSSNGLLYITGANRIHAINLQ